MEVFPCTVWATSLLSFFFDSDQLNQMYKVEKFVPMLPKDYFVLDITGGGKKVTIRIYVSPFLLIIIVLLS